MTVLTKRRQLADKCVDPEKVYPLKEAMELIQKFPTVKFDETVELHLHLNVDIKTSEQAVRGTVALPHGTGKKIRIAVVCKGEQSQKAKEAGAEHVGGTELIDQIMKGFMDFDCLVCTPDMMRDLSKLGKVLGPRGLMPSPKAGTVTQDVERAVKELKSGRIEFKSDKQGGIHVGIGKRSFTPQQLLANATTALDAIGHAKPAAVKGNLIKTLAVSTTMGPGIKVSLS